VAAIRAEVDAAIAEVLDSAWFVLGKQVETFEREFAEYLEVPGTLGVANGTDALRIALQALGIGPGDEVVTVANAGIYAVATVDAVGARPVPVDVDPATHAIDPALGERAITPRTKAILLVHLYGGAADLDALGDLARRRGLFLVEDCAQSHGARLHGRRLGSFGDVATFSFYPTKNLGAYGDGGAIAARDPAVLERVRMIRQYGWTRQYHSEIKGLNSRLDELQAAILRVKLRHLDDWNAARRALAARYDAGLRGVEPPTARPDSEHAYHLYVVRSSRRDELRAHLADRGIGTGIHYPEPAHLQPAYDELDLGPGSLPETERAAREVLSLPIYPELEPGEVERVIQAVNDFSSEFRVPRSASR
jgi:dTDP-3-amino-3,4,6-trideoxy-alpha-D-glucose transaminase